MSPHKKVVDPIEAAKVAAESSAEHSAEVPTSAVLEVATPGEVSKAEPEKKEESKEPKEPKPAKGKLPEARPKAEPRQLWRVAKNCEVRIRGVKTKLKAGKLIDPQQYDGDIIESLKSQGVELSPEQK